MRTLTDLLTDIVANTCEAIANVQLSPQPPSKVAPQTGKKKPKEKVGLCFYSEASGLYDNVSEEAKPV